MNLSGSYELATWHADTPASADDEQLDAQIRRLLAACQMPTPILSLSYHAEPSFRRALACQGDEHHLVFARNREDGELKSLGIRSLRSAMVQGQACRLAYIHHLRIHPRYAGSTLLARGYQAFREVSRGFPAVVTTTSILEGNRVARDLLANQAGRGPLPAYRPLSRYLTALIPLRGPGARWPRRGRISVKKDWVIRPLETDDLVQLSDLYCRVSRIVDGVEIPGVNSTADACRWPGLRPPDLLGAFAGEELVGVMGVWNRMPVQQIRLSVVHPVLRMIRRVWEAGRFVWGACPVPEPGSEVPHLLLDPWLILPGREHEIGLALLEAALAVAAREGALFAALGVPEWHPMRSVVCRFFHLPYWSMLYTVRWSETPVVPTGVENRLIAPLGTL